MIMLDRYTSPTMKAIWSEQGKYTYWLSIEQQVCKHLQEHGLAPEGTYNAVSDVKITKELIDEIENREKIIKHDVLAFVEVVCEKLPALATSAFHRGLTSSDIVDTTLGIRLTKCMSIIIAETLRVIIALTKFRDKYKNIKQIGRTHGMHTEPITLGHKIYIWIDELFRHKERLDLALSQISVGKLSGPVGMRTGDINFESESQILGVFGLRMETSANQIVQRDRHAFMLSVLALLASSIEKFATEIRHLSRPEIGEICEGFAEGQKGSSSMPHKKNPISSENLCGLARVVRAQAQIGMENMNLWHERDIFHSSAERYVFPIVTSTMEHMLKKFRKLIENLDIHEDRLEENLTSDNGYNLSGIILYTLQKNGMPRNEAYNIVQHMSLSHRYVDARPKYFISNLIEMGQLSREYWRDEDYAIFNGIKD
jgi:adenylosuccinate lyase